MINAEQKEKGKKAVLTFPGTHRAQGMIFHLDQSQKLF